jgi:hypothetical protein
MRQLQRLPRATNVKKASKSATPAAKSALQSTVSTSTETVPVSVSAVPLPATLSVQPVVSTKPQPTLYKATKTVPTAKQTTAANKRPSKQPQSSATVVLPTSHSTASVENEHVSPLLLPDDVTDDDDNGVVWNEMLLIGSLLDDIDDEYDKE